MSPVFHAEPSPSRATQEVLAALSPTNPFCSPAYGDAMHALGWKPWALTVLDGGAIVAGCFAFMRSGLLYRTVEVPSLPSPLRPHEKTWWSGLLKFCKHQGVRSLTVSGYGSSNVSIPPAVTTAISSRREYVVDLETSDLEERFWERHRALIAQARDACIAVRCAQGLEASRRHVAMARKVGWTTEGLETTAPNSLTPSISEAIVSKEAGMLLQAVQDGNLMASVLVLTARRGAYVHSIGITAEGVARGAPHLLIAHLAQDCRRRHMKSLNLGEADESNPWLETFNAGFGAHQRSVLSARLGFGPVAPRKLGTALRFFRQSPLGFVRHVFGRVERYVAYSAEPQEIAPPDQVTGVTFEKLSDTRLAELCAIHPEASVHLERSRRLGFNDAYGVFVAGELAHISWLVGADHDRLCPVRNVKVRPGEAEIGPCSTLPRFRGRGLYAYAIRSLAQIAAAKSIRRLYMITHVRNRASQRGIEKGGLRRCGSIVRIVFPFLSSTRGITLRGHRLRKTPS